MKRYAEAEPELLASLDGLQAALGDGHPHIWNAITTLAELYEAWEKPERAKEYRALLPPPK